MATQSVGDLASFLKPKDESVNKFMHHKSSSTIKNAMDRKSIRKRTMTNSGSLISLKKMEVSQLKENYLDDDVIAMENVKNVVDMM